MKYIDDKAKSIFIFHRIVFQIDKLNLYNNTNLKYIYPYHNKKK